MANHCIDVTCMDCGNNWCVRGCSNDSSGPDKARANRAKNDLRPILCENERCVCGSKNVAHGNYYPTTNNKRIL